MKTLDEIIDAHKDPVVEFKKEDTPMVTCDGKNIPVPIDPFGKLRSEMVDKVDDMMKQMSKDIWEASIIPSYNILPKGLGDICGKK